MSGVNCGCPIYAPPRATGLSHRVKRENDEDYILLLTVNLVLWCFKGVALWQTYLVSC